MLIYFVGFFPRRRVVGRTLSPSQRPDRGPVVSYDVSLVSTLIVLPADLGLLDVTHRLSSYPYIVFTWVFRAFSIESFFLFFFFFFFCNLSDEKLSLCLPHARVCPKVRPRYCTPPPTVFHSSLSTLVLSGRNVISFHTFLLCRVSFVGGLTPLPPSNKFSDLCSPPLAARRLYIAGFSRS